MTAGLLSVLLLGCVDQVATCEAPPGDGTADPYLAGPHAVETTTLKVDIHSRTRDRPLDAYVPQGVDEAPLLIFHHGFAAPRNLYHETACHMAGWGFATVMAQWDESFVINQNHAELREDSLALMPALEELSLLESVDMDRIGVAGHSRGGKQALFHAVDDPDIHAVFAIDPVDGGSPFGDPNPDKFPPVADELGELSTPTGIVGAGRGDEVFEGGAFSAECAPEESNYQVLYEAASAPTTLWTLPEAGHADFADPCAADPEECEPCVAGEDPAFSHDVAGALAVSFFQLHLQGNEDATYWLSGEGLPAGVELDQR